MALAKFHEARASIGPGGFARRFAVALSALLLAASPWIVQTTLNGGEADASTVPPAKVEAASVQPPSKAAGLPKGRVYGADNTHSRLTLRIHRPTRVTVNGRGGRLLFSRSVQAGDTYRAPSLPDLTVTTQDAGAVEVVLDGKSAGFVGGKGAAVQRAPLARFASLAPRPAAPATPPPVRAVPRSEPPAVAVTPPVARVEAPAIVEPTPEPPPVQDVAKDEVPAPPAVVEEVPAPPPVAVASVPPPVEVQQQAVSVPPVAQPEARRRLIDRVRFWRNRETAPAEAVTGEVADRQQAAADAAKAAREAAEAKAREENRRRNAAFSNSGRGISSPY